MTQPTPPPEPTGSGWQQPSGPFIALPSRPSLDRLPPRLVSALVRIASLPAGATILACLFGLIALPTAIFGVPGYDMSLQRTWGMDAVALSPFSPAVLSASVGAVVASLLVAPFGAVIVRRHLVTGALVTLTVAWFLGIFALPVAPSLLGFRYGAVNFCLDSCYPQIVGMNGGIEAFITDHKPDPFALFFSAFYGFPPLVSLVIGVSVWAAIVRRASDQRGS